jgi:hypothetical protein
MGARTPTRLCILIVIEGLGRIPTAQALQMAHRIADEVTP